MYAHGAVVPVVITRLLAIVDGRTMATQSKKPRCLLAGQSASVALELATPLSLERFEDCRPLGRFALRQGDTTIAQGIVTKLPPPQGTAVVKSPGSAALSQ